MPSKEPLETFNERWRGYLRNVEAANSEATRCFDFLNFLKEVFADISADYAERLSPQLERWVKVRGSSVLVRSGRIDALLGNLILEFKVALDPARFAVAKDELQKYVAALWTEEGDHRRSYFAIATDGIDFRVFRPRTIKASGEFAAADITLEPVDSLNFRKVDAEVAFRWLDRYALHRERVPPTTEDMANDFGLRSTAFRVVMERITEAWSQGQAEALAPFREWDRYLSVVYGESQGSRDLFLRHTYLATLAKLMVYVYYSGGAIPASSEEVEKILSGSAFKDLGIENFLEEDFFSWVIRGEGKVKGLAASWQLLEALGRYDMAQLNEDVLKGLYQELVDPEARHDLGEYYTPDWLAEWIVRDLAIGPDQRVLDPACGSGTFLAATIRLKREHLGRAASEALGTILTTVMGIDVHPLAVLVAKANYLMALGDLIRYRAGRVHIPVYLSNSIDFPEAKPDVAHTIQVYRYPVGDGRSLAIPKMAVESDWIGDVIDAVEEYARMLVMGVKPPERQAFWDYIKGRVPGSTLDITVIDTFLETSVTLSSLIKENLNTIYAFLIKNVYKPAVLGRFDFIVGNPPWLSYRYVRLTEYQEDLKKMIIGSYRLLDSKETKLLTQMELATLFFVRTAHIFLVDKGTIAFVMPRSVFTSNQHDAFRRGAFVPPLQFTEVIDLTGVEPLFNVPSCVVVGKKVAGTGLPDKGTRVSGKLPMRNASYPTFRSLQAQGKVKVESLPLEMLRMGQLTAWSLGEQVPNARVLRPGPSYYIELFHQGATIVPRTAWFVTLKSHPKLGFDRREPFAETSERAIARAKKDYGKLRMSGRVEAEYLFATITGSEILPFVHLPLPTVVLPAEPHGQEYRMLGRREVEARGHANMARWLATLEGEWKRLRGSKAEKASLYKWLDWQHKLTHQDPSAKFSVVYNTSGTYLSSCVVALPDDLAVGVNGFDLRRRGLVVDAKGYEFYTNSRAEADYLCGVLNSGVLDTLVKPMQSQGLFGPRDLHKKPLEASIPKFDSSDPTHRKIASLAGACTDRLAPYLPEALSSIGGNPASLGPHALGRLRTKLRTTLGEELKEIDGLVQGLLYI